MSPYRPTFSEGSPLSGTALVMNTRSPQTIGLEWPSPGISVFQRMFFPDSPFHSTGGDPAPAPLADGPRNCGQSESDAKAAKANRSLVERFMNSVYCVVAALPFSTRPVLPQSDRKSTRLNSSHGY